MRTLPIYMLLISVLGLPVSVAVAEPAKPAAEEAEIVRFPASDGIEIVADYTAPLQQFKRPAPVAILLHMYRSDRAAYKPLVPVLRDAGFAVLALDLRGHGESGGEKEDALRAQVVNRAPEVFRAMYQDVEGAYAWLASHKTEEVDLSRFVLVGASVGCSVALDYAARDRSVDAIVCLTPGENYLGLDSTSPASNLRKQPALLLATEDERRATDSLHKLNPCITKEIVAPGRVHGTRMFGEIKDIEKRIARFLSMAVTANSPAGPQVYGLLGGESYVTSVSDWQREPGYKASQIRRFSSAAEAEERGLLADRAASGDGAMTRPPESSGT